MFLSKLGFIVARLHVFKLRTLGSFEFWKPGNIFKIHWVLTNSSLSRLYKQWRRKTLEFIQFLGSGKRGVLESLDASD